MSLCSAPCGFLEKKGGYAHGFCSCFRSPVVCIATFFCPCIVVGRIAGEMDGRDFSCIPCLCGVLGEYRLRRDNQASFATAETHDSSMIASTCCHCCAVIQDAHQWSERKTAARAAAATAPAAVDEPEAAPDAAAAAASRTSQAKASATSVKTSGSKQ